MSPTNRQCPTCGQYLYAEQEGRCENCAPDQSPDESGWQPGVDKEFIQGAEGEDRG